jgi:hypothetical protein
VLIARIPRLEEILKNGVRLDGVGLFGLTNCSSLAQNAAGLAPPPFTIQSIEVCTVTDMAHWNN